MKRSRLLWFALLMGMLLPAACKPQADSPVLQATPTAVPLPAPSLPEIIPPEQYKGSIRFKNYNLEQGLSNSTVNCILQDQQGFMWFGTQDGLNRFDGYNFKIFTPDPGDPYSLSDRWITALLEDTSGNIWIGTRQGGLNQYTPTTGRFTQFQHDPANLASIGSNAVLSLFQSQDGSLWVGNRESLDRFNPPTSTFTHYYNQPDKPNTPGANAANAILQSSDGLMWVGTNGGGLARFEPDTGNSFTTHTKTTSRESISNDYVTRLALEPDGKIWAVTAMGLNLFDPVSETFTHYYHSPSRPSGLASDDIQAIFVDHEGTLWVGTRNALDRFDRTTGTFIHYRHDPAVNTSISTSDVLSLHESRDHTLWIGTLGGGVNIYDREQENFAVLPA